MRGTLKTKCGNISVGQTSTFTFVMLSKCPVSSTGASLGGQGCSCPLPPPIWKIVTFWCFCTQNVFFIFCPPPQDVGQNVTPPPGKNWNNVPGASSTVSCSSWAYDIAIRICPLNYLRGICMEMICNSFSEFYCLACCSGTVTVVVKPIALSRNPNPCCTKKCTGALLSGHECILHRKMTSAITSELPQA